MSKPVLAWDADDVCWPFNERYVRYHNREYGTDFRYEDIYTFDMPLMYGLSLEEMLENVTNFTHTRHHELVPYRGVITAQHVLSGTFFQHIVTSRAESIRDLTVGALNDHDFSSLVDYHFTNGFSPNGTPNKRTKLQVCRAIDAVGLVEDVPVNILQVANAGIPVFMPDRPWNQLHQHPELDHPQVFRFFEYESLPGLIAEVIG